MKTLLRFIQAAMLAIFASATLAQTYEQREAPRVQQAELDQILAPIALYPDSLLSQLLIAATYPRDVAEAAAWSRANPDMQGDEAVRAVERQQWDPSVKSLVAFPQVLAMMDERLDWTERIGDAFMQAPEQVADTVQLLRGRADQAGNLQSSGEIVVNRDYGSYTIEPATPEVVYVPYYDPRTIYGQWWWPDYQPVWWGPWAGYHWSAGYPGFGWGYGVTIGAGFWFSTFDWPRHYIRFHGHRPYYYRGHSHSHGHRWYSDRDHRRNVRGWDGGSGNGRWNARGDARSDGRRDAGAGRRDGDGRADGRGRDGRDGREGRRGEGERRAERGGQQGVVASPGQGAASPGQGTAAASNPLSRGAVTPSYRDSAVAGDAQRAHQPRVLPTSPVGRGYGYTGPTTSVAPSGSSGIERAPQRAHAPSPAPQAPVASPVARPQVLHVAPVQHAPQVQAAPHAHVPQVAPQPIAREPRAERSERVESAPARESRSNDSASRPEGRMGGGGGGGGGGRGGGRQRD